MSSSYATEHASALADVAEAGADASFTLSSPGTYDETTDSYSTPSTTTVAGQAVEMEPDFEMYRALSLTHESARTLFFVPSTLGSLPKSGYAITWSSVGYTVKGVKPLAPNGSPIAATVVITQ